MRRSSTLRINDFQDQSGGIGFSGACIIVFHCQTVANARRNIGGLLTLDLCDRSAQLKSHILHRSNHKNVIMS